jgi:hypothetical protein
VLSEALEYERALHPIPWEHSPAGARRRVSPAGLPLTLEAVQARVRGWMRVKLGLIDRRPGDLASREFRVRRARLNELGIIDHVAEEEKEWRCMSDEYCEVLLQVERALFAQLAAEPLL